ncbi:HEAT repeat domain-containing protein [Streptomyces virginiae]|uniref:HEAT repeat domain-containing protein n=1 Tax=Streptomyces virginiae TaxID=1961 RepID=UPI0022591298|nr:HEAT repeat domain-containing protein [Streptomyces virginiae]MCX4960682.1 HEAT repeat domain-containing protein [Streptomyces virginiae]
MFGSEAGDMWEALDAVDWRALGAVGPDHPATDVPKVLRRIARADSTTRPEAVERACGDLQDLVLGSTAVGTAALPFVVDLALDPETVPRPYLVGLLMSLAGDGEGVDSGRAAVWWQQWPRIRRLLDDGDPEVRRETLLMISDRTEPLLERWHVETDPSVQVALLVALGRAAADEDLTESMDAEVRAVLDGLLHDENPVLRVAAVVASSPLDPQAVPRAVPELLEILTDPVVAPRFGEVWYALECEYPYDRNDVAEWVGGLLEPDLTAATSFVAALAEAGSRMDDAGLRRCAVDQAWRLLSARPSVAAAVLPLAAGLLADPDDDVRYKAAHLLAVLGREAAPHADRLAALLDDTGESRFFDGTVGDHARWALTRIGDPRALPDLVERLVAPYRDMQGRGYDPSDPRQPDVADVLRPLRAHARVLLPAVREALQDEVSRAGWLVQDLRDVLHAWGENPLLPGELTPYRQPWEPPLPEPAEAAARVLTYAADGQWHGMFTTALDALAHHGHLTPPVREALTTLKAADRRLSEYGDYRAVLQDEEIRARIDRLLVLP